MNLIPAMHQYFASISEFYGKINAGKSDYDALQNCIDRVEIIQLLDLKEQARLLVLDWRLFQALLPHLGYPEFFTLRSQLYSIIDSARMVINPNTLINNK